MPVYVPGQDSQKPAEQEIVLTADEKMQNGTGVASAPANDQQTLNQNQANQQQPQQNSVPQGNGQPVGNQQQQGSQQQGAAQQQGNQNSSGFAAQSNVTNLMNDATKKMNKLNANNRKMQRSFQQLKRSFGTAMKFGKQIFGPCLGGGDGGNA